MSSPVNYTAKDIERYHRGEMSAAERHLLEKAALDDPMLADALEGYTIAATPVADVTRLHNRLQQRVKSKEKDRFTPMLPWLKIAALFLLLAGSGWIVFRTLAINENSIATTREENAATEASISATTDSAAPVNSSTAAILPADSTTVATIATARPITKPSATPAAPALPPVSTAVPAEGAIAKREQNAPPATEKVVAPPADIAAARDNTATQIDRIANDTSALNDVALQKNKAQKEEDATFKRREQPSARSMRVANTAEPVEGWTAFENYIASQQKAVMLKKELPANGEVELSFTVDKNGTPVNIIVIKSLCKRCDETAINLLEKGPKWKEKGAKGLVRIKL